MHFPRNLVRDFEERARKRSGELALVDATSARKATHCREY
jgi:hypothetical protein